jgi:tripartite-type tricarboxylate transporter receptor subunit TctC
MEGVMRSAVFAVLIATLTCGGGVAVADHYPSRIITVIVPFSAGGPSDAMARILAERMKTTLGETIAVENVTGAGGSLGVGRAVHAPPDGYTVSFGHLGTHVANGAIYKLGYDLVTDLEPVVLDHRQQERRSGQVAQGADRLDQGEAGPGHRRHRGRRFGEPHRRALF